MQVRSSRRSVISALALAAFTVLLIFPAAASAANDPIILSASLNGDELTIQGEYLGSNRPSVKLGNTALAVTSFSPTKVVVAMPVGGLPPGTYRLQYTRANGAGTDFVLTIGSAGARVVLVDGAGHTLGTVFGATFDLYTQSSGGTTYIGGAQSEFSILREGNIWQVRADGWIHTEPYLDPPRINIGRGGGSLIYSTSDCTGSAYVRIDDTGMAAGPHIAHAYPKNMVFASADGTNTNQYYRLVDNLTPVYLSQCYINTGLATNGCRLWGCGDHYQLFAVEKLSFPEELCVWYPDYANPSCPLLIEPLQIVIGQ